VSDLIDLLETEFFQTGFRVGLAALAIGLLLTFTVRRGKQLPLTGLILAAGVLIALVILDQQIDDEIVAIAAIGAGVVLARLIKAPEVIVALASVPGAVWLAITTDVTDVTWVRVTMAVLIPIAGYLIVDFEARHAGLGLGVISYTLAVIGVFLAIPDTEWALVLMAVSVPLTFLAWPVPRARLGVEGAFLSVAIFIVVIAQGSGSRPASIIGSIACLGVLLIEPVLMATTPGIVKVTSWPSRDWKGALLASIPQFVIVAACSRLAARFTDVLPSMIVVIIIYAVTVFVAVSASRDEADRSVG
jgi:hypothetical protein